MSRTVWTRDEIVSLLKRNDRAVEAAMCALYRRQTIDERVDADTRHSNRRGFTVAHAKKGTYYAKWVLSGRKLTGKHLDRAREISLHYVRQLLEQAAENARAAG